jgi:hypothetical protein
MPPHQDLCTPTGLMTCVPMPYAKPGYPAVGNPAIGEDHPLWLTISSSHSGSAAATAVEANSPLGQHKELH